MRVFLSHASDDAEFAHRLERLLEHQGLDVVTAQEVVSPGAYWAAEIHRAIQESDAFLVVVSRAGEDSQWVQLEQAASLARASKDPTRRVVPILLGRDVSLPPMLTSRHAIVVTDPEDIGAIAASVADALRSPYEVRTEDLDEVRRNVDLRRTILAKETEDADFVRSRYQRLMLLAITLAFAVAVVATGAAITVDGGFWTLVAPLGASAIALISSIAGYLYGRVSRRHYD